jgi:hypothetical protein
MRACLARWVTVLCATVLMAGCTTTATRAGVDEQIVRLTPGLTLTFEETPRDRRSPYAIRSFSYGLAPAWPYGRGFAVVSSSQTVLWIYLHHGDFPPHEIRWADFDGDRAPDLFFHAGFEDVATTQVYVNRVASNAFGVSQFALAYENREVYAIVLDLDADGVAELLVPERYPDEDDPCASELRALAGARADVRDEYRRLAGSFDAFNFKFGAPGAYDGLAMFEKVRIEGVGRSLATKPVADHVRWRLGVLRDARSRVSPGCRDRVDHAITYLQTLLREP